jgi:hypothetical protein
MTSGCSRGWTRIASLPAAAGGRGGASHGCSTNRCRRDHGGFFTDAVLEHAVLEYAVAVGSAGTARQCDAHCFGATAGVSFGRLGVKW